MTKKLLGIIGYPLSHTFSPEYFRRKFEKENISGFDYRAFPLDYISKFPALLKQNPDLAGLNVTIPYKEAIIPFLHELEDVARKTGAVNTIKIVTKKLLGYNTDVEGFRLSLLPLLNSGHAKALVLGSGGASKAVCYVLENAGIDFLIVSSSGSGDLGYSNLTPEIIQEYLLIINTTPLGMWPHTEAGPDIPYLALTDRHLLYDLIYTPSETLFLQKGKSHGAAIKNGLQMLELQAEASWRIWTT
jgi:shikimate dehydrogenase